MEMEAVGSVNQFHTLTWPVPSPVKNMPTGPIWIVRISCFVNIFPLSENLKKQAKHDELVKNEFASVYWDWNWQVTQ